MDYDRIDKLIMKYIIIIALIVLFVTNFNSIAGFGEVVFKAFGNIFLAIAVAYVINLIMSRLENLMAKSKNHIILKIKRPLSLLLSLLMIVLIFYALLNLVIPEFSKATSVLIEALPQYFNDIKNFLIKEFGDIPTIEKELSSLQIDWSGAFQKVLSVAASGIGNVLGTTYGIVTSIVGSLFNLVLVIVFSIYLLLDKDRFIGLYHRLASVYLPTKQKDKLTYVMTTFNKSFRNFITGQCIEAVILGTMCAIGMFILRMPYAVMIGTLVGTINTIPIIGAYIGGAMGWFLIFTVNPMQSIWFVIYLTLLQQFESNVIYPRVVGTSVGLPAVFILASVMVFGAIAGIPGMFVGIPIVAALYKMSKTYLAKEEALKISKLKN